MIVHTNLGRAPLAEAALARAIEIGASYSNLELDLRPGHADRGKTMSPTRFAASPAPRPRSS